MSYEPGGYHCRVGRSDGLHAPGDMDGNQQPLAAHRRSKAVKSSSSSSSSMAVLLVTELMTHSTSLTKLDPMAIFHWPDVKLRTGDQCCR